MPSPLHLDNRGFVEHKYLVGNEEEDARTGAEVWRLLWAWQTLTGWGGGVGPAQPVTVCIPERDKALGTQLEGADRPRGQTQGRAGLFFLKVAGGEEGKGISGQRNSRSKGSEADVSPESTSRTTAGEARASGGEAGAEAPLPPSTGASLLRLLPPRW